MTLDARRQRVLAAMGIDVWVRRDAPRPVPQSALDALPPGAEALDSGAPGSGAPGSGAPGSGAPGSGAPGSGAPGSGVPGSGAPGRGAPGPGAPDPQAPTLGGDTPRPSTASPSAPADRQGLRALHDAVDAHAAPARAALDDARDTDRDPVESPTEAPAAGAPEPVRSVEGATASGASVPEFRLQVLALGASLLLVDAQALGVDARVRLQRLGDLVRAACLLRGGSAAGSIESQVFYWPQIEGGAVDQTMPRAVEALRAFVQRRVDAEGGVLVLVESAPGLVEQDGAAMLATLDALPVPRARVAASFLEAADGDADRSAWAALVRLAQRGSGAARGG